MRVPEGFKAAIKELGGEKGIAAQRKFRRRTREIMEVFRDSFLPNTHVGPAQRRLLVRDVSREFDDAAIEFQAEMSECNQKV